MRRLLVLSPLRACLALLPLALLLAACLPAGMGRLPGPPRQATPAPDYDPARLEGLALAAANDARAAHGLPTLRADAALTRAARAHSADLARTGRFSHTGSDGSVAADRAARAGARYRALGENLYRSSLYASGTRTVHPDGTVIDRYDWLPSEALAREAVQSWLNSPGHRANLLNPTFGRAGTGVALDGDLNWVLTMVYAD